MELPENIKNEGNALYKMSNYNDALIKYTQAIEMDPSNDIYYLNRGYCYKKLNNIDNALKDAQLSVDYNDNNIKSHLLIGQCLMLKAKESKDISFIDKGFKKLSKATSLCSGQNKRDLEPKIEIYIKRANKLKYLINKEKTYAEENTAYNQIKLLIENDTGIEDNLRTVKLKNLEKLFNFQNNNLFNYQIPEYLKCPISKNIMSDPVIVDCGFSYERGYLMDYLRKNNGRCSHDIFVSPERIISNYNLKNFITEEFIKENPWAFEIEKKSISEIEF